MLCNHGDGDDGDNKVPVVVVHRNDVVVHRNDAVVVVHRNDVVVHRNAVVVVHSNDVVVRSTFYLKLYNCFNIYILLN